MFEINAKHEHKPFVVSLLAFRLVTRATIKRLRLLIASYVAADSHKKLEFSRKVQPHKALISSSFKSI